MRELIRYFLKLGFLGFGGPIAVMSMMEDEACEKKKWLTREKFTEMYAVFKVMPGPLAAQMAVYLGTLRKGRLGGLISGICFVLPSFLLVLGFSYVYVKTGHVHKYDAVMGGLQAGALAVIFLSAIQLSRPYRKKTSAWIIAITSGVVIGFMPRWEPLVIIAFGIMGAVLMIRKTRIGPIHPKTLGILILAAGVAGLMGTHTLWADSAATAVSQLPVQESYVERLMTVTWVCLKAGAFVFGSGLAIVPMLEGDFVSHYHWVTHKEFMDGLAIGQVTPGPVVITSTFLGYKSAGALGALLATVAIFIPSVFNVLFVLPRILKKVNGTPGAVGFTSWAFPSVVGGILGTGVKLGYMTLNTPMNLTLFAIAFAVALWKNPPAWLLIPLTGAAAVAANWIF